MIGEVPPELGAWSLNFSFFNPLTTTTVRKVLSCACFPPVMVDTDNFVFIFHSFILSFSSCFLPPYRYRSEHSELFAISLVVCRLPVREKKQTPAWLGVDRKVIGQVDGNQLHLVA